MDSLEVLKNLELADDATQIVVVCGNSEYGIDFFNSELEIVVGKKNYRNVGYLRKSIQDAMSNLSGEVCIKIEDDSFDIDLIAFNNRLRIYDCDETGNPKLIIFPEDRCVEKYGLHSFLL